VWIEADPAERARRVAEREGCSVEAALAANEAREASEHLRYLTYYGIDQHDRSVYDVVLDSTAVPAPVLAESIIAAATK
jgi:cytidylate kinase